MNLFDIIGPNCVVPDLLATTRDEAIFELVDALDGASRLSNVDKEEVVLALLKREALASTHFEEHGVAIPHAKMNLVADFVGALGISKGGINFWSPSDESSKVHIIVLFLSPERAISGHLQLMARISGLIRHPQFIGKLCAAGTQEDLISLLKDAESQILDEEPL